MECLTCSDALGSPTEVSQLVVQEDASLSGVDQGPKPAKKRDQGKTLVIASYHEHNTSGVIRTECGTSHQDQINTRVNSLDYIPLVTKIRAL